MFNYRALFAWVAGAILLSAATCIFAGFDGKPHLSGLVCSNCHLAGMKVDTAQASQLIASQEMLCGICHKNVERMSHPTGFAPEDKLPAGFPLGWKNDMTCSTCHDIHGTNPGLLRGERRGMDLCLACHDTAFFAGMKDAGISLQQSGHVIADMSQMDKSADIDALSLQCMGCHIKQTDAAGIRDGLTGIVSHSGGGANHPIGVAYPADFSHSDYHPKSALPKHIWLPNGKLSCVTCHQPYKKEHGQLVMPNDRRSSLCTQCHDL